jgi:hypothetical protein
MAQEMPGSHVALAMQVRETTLEVQSDQWTISSEVTRIER